MRFSLSSAGLQDWNGDVLAVGLPQGDPSETAAELDKRFNGLVASLEKRQFKGKSSETFVSNLLGGAEPQRLVVIGPSRQHAATGRAAPVLVGQDDARRREAALVE